MAVLYRNNTSSFFLIVIVKSLKWSILNYSPWWCFYGHWKFEYNFFLWFNFIARQIADRENGRKMLFIYQEGTLITRDNHRKLCKWEMFELKLINHIIIASHDLNFVWKQWRKVLLKAFAKIFIQFLPDVSGSVHPFIIGTCYPFPDIFIVYRNGNQSRDAKRGWLDWRMVIYIKLTFLELQTSAEVSIDF